MSIIDMQIARLSARLREQQLSVRLTERAKEFVADEAYDPVYGARPIKRFIQGKIETMIGRQILKGGVGVGADASAGQSAGAGTGVGAGAGTGAVPGTGSGREFIVDVAGDNELTIITGES
jgi:hypothetical protein